jgi:predicted  nucleic acid-binding Zn-ribbon protein
MRVTLEQFIEELEQQIQALRENNRVLSMRNARLTKKLSDHEEAKRQTTEENFQILLRRKDDEIDTLKATIRAMDKELNQLGAKIELLRPEPSRLEDLAAQAIACWLSIKAPQTESDLTERRSQGGRDPQPGAC